MVKYCIVLKLGLNLHKNNTCSFDNDAYKKCNTGRLLCLQIKVFIHTRLWVI